MLAWSETRTASGVAAVVTLFDLIPGLLGGLAYVRALPPDLPVCSVAVLLGAVIGTAFGIGRLPQQGVLKALGAVLVEAGLKLVGVY